MTIIDIIRRLFRRRVVVQHYTVERTKLQELQDALHAELARELGREWPKGAK